MIQYYNMYLKIKTLNIILKRWIRSQNTEQNLKALNIFSKHGTKSQSIEHNLLLLKTSLLTYFLIEELNYIRV